VKPATHFNGGQWCVADLSDVLSWSHAETEKKRSFVRRHSSRGRRSGQSPGPDSPRLDRHPSLRFSTTRLPSGRVVRPQPTARACTLAVTKPPTTAGETLGATDQRKGSTESNASSIGTCHDLGPSPSAYSINLATPHPEGNRSSSSAETAAVEGAARDDAVGLHSDQGLVANRPIDVSHINLLHTSEHELSSARRRFEDGLDVHAVSSTVDRLSPASCRRRPPKTSDTSPSECSIHRRDVQLDPSHAEGAVPGTEGLTDLVLIAASALAVLLLTSPTQLVGLFVVMCTGRCGWHDRPVGVDVVFSLHVVAYVGALVRPAIYCAFSTTLRQSLLALFRCRTVSHQTRTAAPA